MEQRVLPLTSTTHLPSQGVEVAADLIPGVQPLVLWSLELAAVEAKAGTGVQRRAAAGVAVLVAIQAQGAEVAIRMQAVRLEQVEAVVAVVAAIRFLGAAAVLAFVVKAAAVQQALGHQALA
jgi:hypothetical protein